VGFWYNTGMGNCYISKRGHLRNAALIWVLVGLMLGVRGTIWIFRDAHTHRWMILLIPLALLLGLFKGTVVLRKSARRAAERISSFEDRTPLWNLYSAPTYLLILGMMGLGFVCRWAGAHWHVSGDVGVLYLVIGIALITGSRAFHSTGADSVR
jgi:hypothetical protein